MVSCAALSRAAVAIGIGASVLAGCAAPEQQMNLMATKRNLAKFISAAQDEAACSAAAGANPAYAPLRPHMPWEDIGQASLSQMTDQSHATDEEIAALDTLNRALAQCRNQLLAVTQSTLPSFGPLIEHGRDQDDAVFVKLAERKITWGDAVMALKANRTALRSDVIANAEKVDSNLDKMQQNQINRRTTLLSSVIRIIP